MLEVLEKPGLCVRSGMVGIETLKALRKSAPEARLLVELEPANYAPGQLFAAQHAGQGFKCHGAERMEAEAKGCCASRLSEEAGAVRNWTRASASY